MDFFEDYILILSDYNFLLYYIKIIDHYALSELFRIIQIAKANKTFCMFKLLRIGMRSSDSSLI